MNYDSPQQKAEELEAWLTQQKVEMMNEIFSALFNNDVSVDDFDKVLDDIIERNGRDDKARQLFEARLLMKYDESFVEIVMDYALKAKADDSPTKAHLFSVFVQGVEGSWGKDEIIAFMAENPL